MKDRAMRIGEVARLAHVSPDTLRHYERQGLIRTPRRTEAGYRMYSQETVGQVALIRSALSLGFTIAQLSRVFKIRHEGGAPCAQVRALASDKLRDLEEQIRRMKQLRRRLRSLIAEWDEMLQVTGPGRPARLLEVLVSSEEKGEQR